MICYYQRNFLLSPVYPFQYVLLIFSRDTMNFKYSSLSIVLDYQFQYDRNQWKNGSLFFFQIHTCSHSVVNKTKIHTQSMEFSIKCWPPEWNKGKFIKNSCELSIIVTLATCILFLEERKKFNAINYKLTLKW